jgi:phosphosulfolactate synthase
MSCVQKKSSEFFNVAKKLGFTTIEISDDVIPPLSLNERTELIKSAQEIGLEVLTEVGRKFPEGELNEEEITQIIENDLDMAVSKVTIEVSEIKNCIELKSTAINRIMDNVGPENIILEVGPNGWPHLHKWAVKNFGSEVNLGNVELEQIIHIEAMRVGLHRNVEYNFIDEIVERFS